MPEHCFGRRWAPLAGLIFVLAMSFAGAANAVTIEQRTFATETQHALYRDLITELRCLVCQNQNLAESDADLARDLRNEVYRMVTAGGTRDDVINFMVERYGDFVLYRPPFRLNTLLLWLGPFVAGALALVALLVHLRRRSRTLVTNVPLDDTEREAVARLLGDGAPDRR